MLILLVSSMIGATVWAKPGKPDKPGKPSHPRPEAANFEIRIGEGSGTQDIALYPLNSPLYVENEAGGYWLPPPTKGKTREVWGVGLGPEGEGDYCGKYDIADVEGDSGYEGVILTEVLADHGIDSDVEAYRFNIFHVTQSHWRVGEGDYWRIRIQWEVGTLENPNPPPPEISHFLILSGNTNTDTEWEGIYNEPTDTWTFTFDNAGFSLHENTIDGGSNELWSGQLSFTVKIKRELVES